MFNSLLLKNFQAHKKLFIEFDPQVTTIVGVSDAGKTAIIRALGWIVFNRPSGVEFIRHGASGSSATLRLDNRTVARRRGKENLYELDGDEYKAFGNNVPEPISQVLNLQPINFQFQHDPIFWLSLSPGQLAKELNDLVNLSSIDNSLSYVNTRLKRSKAQEDVSKQRLKALRREKRALSWVTKADALFRRVEHLDRRLQQKEGEIESLGELITQIKKVEKPQHVPDLQPLDTLKERMDAVTQELEELDSLLTHISEARTELCRATKLRQEARKQLRKLTKGRCPICGNPIKG